MSPNVPPQLRSNTITPFHGPPLPLGNSERQKFPVVHGTGRGDFSAERKPAAAPGMPDDVNFVEMDAGTTIRDAAWHSC